MMNNLIIFFKFLRLFLLSSLYFYFYSKVHRNVARRYDASNLNKDIIREQHKKYIERGGEIERERETDR